MIEALGWSLVLAGMVEAPSGCRGRDETRLELLAQQRRPALHVCEAMNEPLSRIEQFKKATPGTTGPAFNATRSRALPPLKRKSRRLRP